MFVCHNKNWIHFLFRSIFCYLSIVLTFTKARMLYLSFNGNGIRGFLIGIINITVVHVILLILLYYAFYNLLGFIQIAQITTLLSGISCYYAALRQAAFDQMTLLIQRYLYLLPLLYFLIFITVKNDKKLNAALMCDIIKKYIYYVAAVIYLLLLPFIPSNPITPFYSTLLCYCHYGVIVTLFLFQISRPLNKSRCNSRER